MTSAKTPLSPVADAPEVEAVQVVTVGVVEDHPFHKTLDKF